MEIRILSLHQPWASLVAMGLKRYETRSWGTPYRGKLAIHAAKRPVNRDEVLPILYTTGGGGCSQEELKKLDTALHPDLPLGAIVAIANLTDCREMVPDFRYPRDTATYRECRYSIAEQSVLEKSVGWWQSGRYAWKLENVRPIANPIYCRGKQGLTVIREPMVLEAIEKQLALTEQIERQLQATKEVV